jgi:hypothetical protein
LGNQGTQGPLSGGSWTTVTSNTTIVSNTNYISDGGVSQLVLTLPSTASVGDAFRIVYKSGLSFKIAQNSGQVISFLNISSTTGTGGYIETVTAYSAIEIVCVTTNTTWIVISSSGQFRVV